MVLNLYSFLAICTCVVLVAGEAQLLTYVDGGIGNILGTFFGNSGTNATYDYVIVGGGNAGLTLATRLASDPSISVAVVEAGGFYETDNGNRSTVPGYATFYTGSDPKNYQPLVDWGFSTVPQAAAGNRTVHYARGKTLGGSSARNYMVYHRPTVGSMQKWADEVGDQSYTWDRFLPFFQKSCNFTSFNPKLYNATILPQPTTAFIEEGGPLHVSFSNYADAFGSWAQKGLVAVGMALNALGLNAGVLNGSAFSTLTIDPRNGYRSSSESSFLQAALQNGTAPTIYKNTLAQKILFSNSSTATGVLVSTAGSFGTPSINFTLSARREVIVSAGAFQSPQLLMISGIGPRNTLQRHNIPLVKDAPGVGQNLQDQVLFGANRRVNVFTASASLNSPAVAARLALQFRNNGSGSLAAFGAGYYGWEKLPFPYRADLSSSTLAALDTFPSDWPELEWLPISAYLGYQTNRQLEDPRDGYNYAAINPGLMAPLSRGNVTISSASMADPPVIDPQWLAHPVDQELAVASFRRSREVWRYLQDAGLTADDNEYLPGFNVTSYDDILSYIGKSLMTIYHAAATCKMGLPNDTMAVIDSRARVYGVQNLRVVDASAFPFLPPGHPQSTVYALAEKIAADILGKDVSPPGYSMTGYYSEEAAIVEYEANFTDTNGPSTYQRQQQGSAQMLRNAHESLSLTLCCIIAGWVINFF
ncbi:MAG: hypothetical protein Q9220_002250 [cf. Caloplaca sp. 1 TL-2023]